MKKIVFILILLLIPAAGCTRAEREQSGKISIVCTTFSSYDWTRRIIGGDNSDRFEIYYLINSGIDLHSYNPSVADMARIKTSDVFIHIGGVSDNWVGGALRDANPGMMVLNLIEILGDSVIYDEQGCDHGDDCDEDHDHDHDELYIDEHICLSLRNVMQICAAIADALAGADPENAQQYRDNASAYIAKLSALDAEYSAAADAADVKTLVFADRFPFRYMMDDYGLEYYAAFYGCSAETEASFVTIISLANRIDQLGLDVVMVTESSDQSIARTVIGNTADKNQRILVLDSIKSVTSSAADSVTYLSIMESNLEVLKEALNRE
jgi:zinc transport system substrate-binding protein